MKNKPIFTYVYIQMCIHVCIYTYTCIYMYVCISFSLSLSLYTAESEISSIHDNELIYTYMYKHWYITSIKCRPSISPHGISELMLGLLQALQVCLHLHVIVYVCVCVCTSRWQFNTCLWLCIHACRHIKKLKTPCAHDHNIYSVVK